MLEDPTMDHKKNQNLRSALPAQTNNNANSEQRPSTKQDAPAANFKSGKSPRFPESANRRRVGQENSAEFRGVNPKQRGGQIKRPPQKSRNPNSDDNNSPMTKDDEYEVGSLYNFGSKKQNLNHLINFQFEPRPFSVNKSRGSNPQMSRKRNEMMVRRPKYSKEQYLQANCQFVVREGEDYDVHLVDADTLVDWNLIEQVVLKTTAAVPSCPICLYPPTAAKITRCGHVFCWSCILHYLALSDHTWRKCPICYESIHRHDLKSVVSVAWKEFQVGDSIEMHLMRRDRNSLFALPVDTYFPDVNARHPNIAQRATYSQLVTATPSQVARDIIARERYELENQYRAESAEPEACFIEEALQYISERESGLGDRHLPALAEELQEEQYDDQEEEGLDEVDEELLTSSSEHLTSLDGAAASTERPRHESSGSDGTATSEAVDLQSEVTAEDLDISRFQPANQVDDSKNGGGSKTPKATFYFYQSSDGQPIFLHAVNVQMMVRQFGAFENCPKVIRGKILEKDNASMTADLRNKLRYLKHLPVTSAFEVCELDMDIPKFSSEVLDEFKIQLDARRRKRQKRAREEKRRDKAIDIEMDKQMGKFPDPKLRIESSFHFPEVGSSNQGLARSTESLASIDSTLSTSPCAWGTQDRSGNLSFAKMLRQGAARPSFPTSRSETFHQVSASGVRPRTTSGHESDPEDYVPPPPKANIGDLLAQALEMSTLKEEGAAPAKVSKKGKKMKGQKICLTGGGPRTSMN